MKNNLDINSSVGHEINEHSSGTEFAGRDDHIQARPFVKWAGGKKQLLRELVDRVPESYNTYFEPMVGGGALFFALRPQRAYISDVNPELMNCYQVIRDNVSELMEDLARHRYESDYFYEIREVDRFSELKKWTPAQRASRFIYLNKACFNGLYRVNSKGFFNVPFGRYTNPKILDEKNLLACNKALGNCELVLESFEDSQSFVKEGDFVYLDPPYMPLNSTSNFTAYHKDGFDSGMHERLRDFCIALDNKNVRFMLSNSHTDMVLDLYKNFKTSVVSAVRAINSKGDKRGNVKEVIVTNY